MVQIKETVKDVALWQEIMLTAKEFDILALLTCNPRRVFTFEMIMELVLDGEGDLYSKKLSSTMPGQTLGTFWYNVAQ